MKSMQLDVVVIQSVCFEYEEAFFIKIRDKTRNIFHEIYL
jgi:hypothetical protein